MWKSENTLIPNKLFQGIIPITKIINVTANITIKGHVLISLYFPLTSAISNSELSFKSYFTFLASTFLICLSTK